AGTHRTSRVVWAVTIAAGVVGVAAAVYYGRQDLTLSHYDARGHLVVARRVIDSLTPGWRQIGGVWLPLPHVLNALPVQLDSSYRTGWSGVLLSIAFLTLGLRALAGYLMRSTASWTIAIAMPLVILLNPNVLYLQSTPMTEAQLFGLSLMSVAAIDRWVFHDDPGQRFRAGGLLAALTLTRYEGWFIVAALVVVAAICSGRRALRLAAYPAIAALLFFFMSYASTGSWLVTSGFYEPNNPALGNPWLALDQVLEGARRLGGSWLLWLGAAGALSAIGTALLTRPDASVAKRLDFARALVPLCLAAAAALPLYAFSSGHPIRIRYMTPLVIAAAVTAAFALARLPRRLHPAGAALCVGVAVWVTPPLDKTAPMVTEAQRERPSSDARRAVTAALVAQWDGTPIMASMGSLGHYMQQLSAQGFAIKDFLHEGNGDIWATALWGPGRFVKWILIEESAEGGDALANQARVNPSFLDGFTRTAASGGVALYVRTEPGNRE
ncbi:MAG TPA: hypothetical protein VMZ90_09895, partial [Vicinamibacterales bacterium]|nr:hypothetical protein [Vicinamibacterales bacterium]